MQSGTVTQTLVVSLSLWALAATATAAHRPPAAVPPGDEIEVLDPNADSLGRPRVELREDCHGLQVDIPPAVLVHKYYYTGDRSFQAQLLPGGPTIIVANHPRTGQRCYVETQLLPGAPRVTYTSHSIDYDYGTHGITLVFGLFGHPKVKYRSGLPWTRKAAEAVHAEQWKSHAQKVAQTTKACYSASCGSLQEAAVDAHNIAARAALPIQNVLRVMPLGAAVMDPDRALIREEKLAEHRRECELEHAVQESRREEQTYATLR